MSLNYALPDKQRTCFSCPFPKKLFVVVVVIVFFFLRKVLELGTVLKNDNSTNLFRIYRHVIPACQLDIYHIQKETTARNTLFGCKFYGHLASSSKFLIKCIILGSINTPTGTKFIWCTYRSLVVTYFG